MAKYTFRTTRTIEVTLDAPDGIDSDDLHDSMTDDVLAAMEDVSVDGDGDGYEWSVDNISIGNGNWDDISNEGL